MASLGLLPAQSGEALESFNSSEFSIIPEELSPEEVSFRYSSNSTVLQKDLMSAMFELSEEEQEIQRRLLELAEDNKTLRETLQQSSAVMRSELSSVAAWHNNITTNMAALKVTLQEAQDRIQELEQEKEELMKKNQDTESLKSQLKEAELNIAALKRKNEEQNLKADSERQLETLKNVEQIERLRARLSDYEQRLDESEARVISLTKELDLAKKDSEQPLMVEAQATEKPEKVRAKRSFDESEDPGEGLLFKKGEILTVISKDEDDWWTAKNSLGQTGLIPVPYIEPASEMPEKVKAKLNFDESEDSRHLLFKKGEILTVISHDEDDWWTAKNSLGQTGLIPVPYIEPVEKDDTFQPNSVENSNPPTSCQTPHCCGKLEVMRIDLENAVLDKETAQEEAKLAHEELRKLLQLLHNYSKCEAGSVDEDSSSRDEHAESENGGTSISLIFLLCPICMFVFTEMGALESHAEACCARNL